MRIEPLPAADLPALVELQRAAYAVEAALIGVESLPPMRETVADLEASGETFLGAYDDATLLGAVSYKRDGPLVDVHRLVVDPGRFRRGIATSLLAALEATEADAREWLVATAAGNRPARRLYEGRGYSLARERVAAGGIRVVELRRSG